MTVTDASGPGQGQCFLGVDVGGTFTDLVFFDLQGAMWCVKVPSTPASPGLATLRGIDELVATVTDDPAVWSRLHHTHSNTVATNALIERTGARLGLLTTAGFRDLFEIQRITIPKPMRYDSRRPLPLAPRSMVVEIPERLDAAGRVVIPLDERAVIEGARLLQGKGAQIVIVCFMHSYRNPLHERLAGAAIERICPGLRVELSCDVWPQAREFERATLTAVNAFVRPVVEGYVADLTAGLADRGIATPARGARSNGGMELLSTMAERPAVALLSGPAAGVAGAAAAALDAGWANANLMTIDVGGTSADIGVVRDGRPVLSSDEHIADFPILIPTVAVSSIGAGGGSVIWVDETGSLKVGPRSVGSTPGPACYGASAAGEAALTDALLLAGFLDPEQRLAGRLPLRIEPARRALAAIGERIGASADEVADGAIRITIAMMAAESINVLARRGVDAPRFRMVAFGGAGPLLAALLAEEVWMDTVLVPPSPGTLSALGAARADLEGDFVRPIYRLLREVRPEELVAELAELRDAMQRWIARESTALALAGTIVRFAAEMRYDGQGFDVEVPLMPEWLGQPGHVDLDRAFHVAHKAAYGHSSPGSTLWIKELRGHVVGRTAKPGSGRPVASGPASPSPRRTVRLRGRTVEVHVVERWSMPAGARLAGPAIVDQMDTTTLVPDGWSAEVATSGAMILSRGSAG